jgi:Fic family protein
LKGACYGLPNPQLLLSPAILREALASSEVENIITTLADVLQAQLFPDSERTDTDKEILRYNEALIRGIDLMEHKNLPLASRVIREIHDTLIPTEPGYRTTQNALINQATREHVYTPPPANTVAGYISDLEKFIHGDGDGDPLIKAAIAHYQFEAIHPFGDGNGRTGRILIVLSLINYGLLDMPVLFTSGYINKTKDEYYKVIKGVTDNQEWHPFISYMLTAFETQAKESTRLLLAIKDLHEKTKRRIREELPKIYSRDMIDAIFSRPFINPTKYGELLKVSYQTGSSHLRQLEAAGFMASIKVGKYHLFINKTLFELINTLKN